VRIKGQDDCRGALGARAVDESVHDLLMTAMDSIEDANGEPGSCKGNFLG